MKRGALTSPACQIVAHFLLTLALMGTQKKLYSVHTVNESIMPNLGHEHDMAVIAHFDLLKKRAR